MGCCCNLLTYLACVVMVLLSGLDKSTWDWRRFNRQTLDHQNTRLWSYFFGIFIFDFIACALKGMDLPSRTGDMWGILVVFLADYFNRNWKCWRWWWSTSRRWRWRSTRRRGRWRRRMKSLFKIALFMEKIYKRKKKKYFIFSFYIFC